jgi:superoxide dismutase, Cu-Zn family
MKRIGLVTALAATLAIYAAPASAAMGKAMVAGTATGSTISGTLIASDTAKGLSLMGDVRGLTPGQHGFHVHEFGDCSDSAKAAGSHYNPMNHPHGNVLKDGPAKAHAGDMGNLEADSQGVARINVVLPGVTLTNSKVTVGGRAVIVHEKADDFGQPVGNAGGRIGCGPIVVTGN